MGTLSRDGYYQDKDEDAYYDSWEFARDQDRLDGIERPDSCYISRHVPVKQAILQGIARLRQREETRKQIENRYKVNKAAKVGETIDCACCGKSNVKTNYQQAFCPPVKKLGVKRYKCRDRYWNNVDPERAARARHWPPNPNTGVLL